MVDALLVSQNLKLKDIDGIAFGAGPGSFTGLRIACGIAQGLAFGANIPVLGVSTLLALAEASGAERAVCCLDARMEKIYYAAYEKCGSDWHAVYEPGLYAPSLGGFRHSDTVAVTTTGIEYLTYYPRDLESLTLPGH